MFSTLKSINKLHPIVLQLCKTPMETLACLDSSLHFTNVHQTFNTIISKMPVETGDYYIRNQNVIIPTRTPILWEFLEAGQATSLTLPLISMNVVGGTSTLMEKKYPEAIFTATQKNPDVKLCFKNSNLTFQDTVGIDFKNAMGKTKPKGYNQVIISDIDIYNKISKACENALLISEGTDELNAILKQLRIYAKNNDWTNQIIYWAENAHKFPQGYLPPLYTNTKVPSYAFTEEQKKAYKIAVRLMRWLSKKAYEKNIPEENFDGSFIQMLMSEKARFLSEFDSLSID